MVLRARFEINNPGGIDPLHLGAGTKCVVAIGVAAACQGNAWIAHGLANHGVRELGGKLVDPRKGSFLQTRY